MLIATFATNSDSGLPLDMEWVEGSAGHFWSMPTVYVSTDAFYLFQHEQIVKFGFEDGGAGLEPVATGTFTGELLNQFSVDEYQGDLRMATTGTDGDLGTHANVWVFRQVGTELKQVGAITGIAPTEQIYAARFDGETAYLVTFRQVDPLFVIDLTEPTAPQLQGELKIPGFSTYLEVIQEGLVIGVGRDDAWGSHLQVSLFDVSDPQAPIRVDAYTFPEEYVTTELISGGRHLGNPPGLSLHGRLRTVGVAVWQPGSAWRPRAPDRRGQRDDTSR